MHTFDFDKNSFVSLQIPFQWWHDALYAYIKQYTITNQYFYYITSATITATITTVTTTVTTVTTCYSKRTNRNTLSSVRVFSFVWGNEYKF